jgi:hypothetical protein
MLDTETPEEIYAEIVGGMYLTPEEDRFDIEMLNAYVDRTSNKNEWKDNKKQAFHEYTNSMFRIAELMFEGSNEDGFVDR